MISRRQFLRWLATFGATGVAVAGYGALFEPLMRLQLSGHTHGGQVRLFGWSPMVPSRYDNRFAYGHVQEQCDVVVSGGLGCSIAPFRFGIPPEIVWSGSME